MKKILGLCFATVMIFSAVSPVFAGPEENDSVISTNNSTAVYESSNSTVYPPIAYGPEEND